MAVQIAQPRAAIMRDPMEGPLYKPTRQPMAPEEKSAAGQMTDMITNKAMESGLEYGTDKVSPYVKDAVSGVEGMFSSAAPVAPTMSSVATPLMQAGADAGIANAIASQSVATAAAPTSLLTTLGTAVPYVGAGLLAAKAFGLFSDGGRVGPLYAADGSRGVEQQLETGKRQDMSKGPIGLLDMFVKGIDALTGYDRANEKRADLPEGKRDMLINKRRNPYTREYPITEEEYQQVMDREPVNLGHGGMAGPLSKVEYKSAGGETYKLSYGGPISKGA